jgi:hypothetical protein
MIPDAHNQTGEAFLTAVMMPDAHNQTGGAFLTAVMIPDAHNQTPSRQTNKLNSTSNKRTKFSCVCQRRSKKCPYPQRSFSQYQEWPNWWIPEASDLFQ